MKRHSARTHWLVHGADGKTVGYISARTFILNDQLRTKDFNRTIGGWSLPEKTFRKVIKIHCDRIQFFERESQRLFRVSVAEYERFAIRFEMGECVRRLRRV